MSVSTRRPQNASAYPVVRVIETRGRSLPALTFDSPVLTIYIVESKGSCMCYDWAA